MLASAKRAGQPDIRSQAALASVSAARDAAGARRLLDFVMTSGYMDHHVAYSVGAAYARLGKIDRSIEWLDRAATTVSAVGHGSPATRCLGPFVTSRRFCT